MNKEGSKKDVLENPEAVVLLGVLGSEDKRAKVITVGIGNRKNVVFWINVWKVSVGDF